MRVEKEARLDRVSHLLSLATLLAFLSFTVFTYYDRLAQYATADQDLTLNRINLFLSDSTQPVLKFGSNLSNIVVGYPARFVQERLNEHFSFGDHLVGNIYYTQYLPFTFVQTSIAILLIAGCIFLLGKLSNWKFCRDYLFYLLALSIALNFPMLKGLCKVLKYDCFSIILGALSLLSYLVAKRDKSTYFFALALFFSALAFIEKDTAISVFIFIVIAEIIIIFIDEKSLKAFLAKLGFSIVIGGLVFLLTLIVTIPKVWANPHELSVIFDSVSDYGVNVAAYQVLGLLGLVAVLMRAKRPLYLAVQHVGKDVTPGFVFSIFGALFIFSIFYQGSDMKWLNTPEIENQIKNQGLFVGEGAAGVTLTTLDRTEFMTWIKVFLSEIRLIVYFLPEILILMLVFLPLIRQKAQYSLDRKSISLMVGFCLLHLFVYAYLLIPIEAKYLTLVMFVLSLLIISFIAGFSKQFYEANKSVGFILIFMTTGAMIIPADQNAPSHFGYMSMFRSRDAEDIRSIHPDDFSFWTWMGWGETSYTLLGDISQRHSGEKITVGYDYLAPFYIPGNIEIKKSFDIRYVSDLSQMDAYLKRAMEDEGLDYIIVSKNTANRSPVLNAVLKKKKELAVYTDRRGGIEYGWVFRPSDLISCQSGGEGEMDE